jgi:cytochrome c553
MKTLYHVSTCRDPDKTTAILIDYERNAPPYIFQKEKTLLSVTEETKTKTRPAPAMTKDEEELTRTQIKWGKLGEAVKHLTICMLH